MPRGAAVEPPALATAAQVLDITVLMGGPSSEREVSLLSGEAIAAALESRGHRVARADISPADVSALDREGIDLVFIALHGDFGESGRVQQLCQQRGLRYIGSGPEASELALDKHAAKQCFAREGLRTPAGVLVDAAEAPDVAALDALRLPTVVKPVDGGSSVDVTIATSRALRDASVDDLLARYGRALVEQFIPGRELTVGILGDDALPVIEIRPLRRFYDYTAKYADDAGTQYVLDHGLAASAVAELQQMALRAHRALGCRDLSRVDFLLDGQQRPWVLEVNTIPGFTSHSLLPKAAASAGIGFAELVERIARMALQR